MLNWPKGIPITPETVNIAKEVERELERESRNPMPSKNPGCRKCEHMFNAIVDGTMGEYQEYFCSLGVEQSYDPIEGYYNDPLIAKPCREKNKDGLRDYSPR
jgi:hypothetical protein